MSQLIQDGAKIIIDKWLKLQGHESLLIVTDDNHLREAQALKKEAEKTGAFVIITIVPIDSPQKGKVFDHLAQSMMKADVIIGATTYSFITTKAVKTALEGGSRFLSLPLSTKNKKSMLSYDFIKFDPEIARKRSEKIIPLLNSGEKVRITTELGTDLTLSVKDRIAHSFLGTAQKKGDFASASFEVYIAPEENSAKGQIIVDGAIGYIGKITEPFKIQFEEGRLIEIEENQSGKELKEYMESFNCPNINVAGEFGIGLNDMAKTEGRCYIEDEAAYKTFHIGLGRNIALGGQMYSNGHFDIIVKNPNIYIDDIQITKNGEIII